MDRRLFIIHSSDVVRKGLYAILRPAMSCEIILLRSLAELNMHEGLSLESPVLIMEESVTNSQQLLDFFGDNVNYICIPVGFENHNPKPDNSITLDDEGHVICEVVKRNWEEVNPRTNGQNSEDLTQRERDVLELVALGHSNKEIADKLHISTHTVISHRKNITEKLGIKSISGLTVYAILNHIIDTTNINPDKLI